MFYDERKFARLGSVEKIEAVADALEAFINELDHRGVEPDLWEEACCAHALSSLALGKSTIAMNVVQLARIPKAERLSDPGVFGPRIPFNRKELKLGLARIRATLLSEIPGG